MHALPRLDKLALQARPVCHPALVRTRRKHASLLLPSHVSINSITSTDGTPQIGKVDATPAAVQPTDPAQVPVVPTSEELEARRKRLWKAAIKLPMYSVAYIPVLVGCAAVFLETGMAPWTGLAGFALAAVLIIAWLNLSNDAFDADTGVDQSKPESVVNLTGNRPLVATLAVVCFAAGTSLLWTLISSTGDWRPAAMLAFSIACGYVYQGPPFRLSYKGLGEPLCFWAFGPSATTAFFIANLPPTSTFAASTALAATTTASGSGLLAAVQRVLAWAPAAVWASSVIVGVTTTLILLTSHFHQIEGDMKAGKRSPLVQMGLDRGLQVLKAGTWGTYVLAAVAAAAGALPWVVLPALAVSLPAARTMIAYADEHYKVPAKIAILKRFACMWHISLGFSLAAGLVAARLVVQA